MIKVVTSEEEAREADYVPITSSYSKSQEEWFARALSDFRGADVVVVDRSIWRRKNEVIGYEERRNSIFKSI